MNKYVRVVRIKCVELNEVFERSISRICNMVFWYSHRSKYLLTLVWGTYAGAARRRANLATVLLRPPSGHRPDRRQAHHAHIFQIGLRLAITQADARTVMPISFR